MEDRIEKTVDLKASVSRVWQALTDHREFGNWFRVALEGPFVVGEISRGRITYPGYEHLEWRALVRAIEPKTRFAYAWCPHQTNVEIDFETEPQTLVEFKLEPMDTGARLTIVESGFISLPDDQRRVDALRSNEGGWTEQVKNIAKYVES